MAYDDANQHGLISSIEQDIAQLDELLESGVLNAVYEADLRAQVVVAKATLFAAQQQRLSNLLTLAKLLGDSSFSSPVLFPDEVRSVGSAQVSGSTGDRLDAVVQYLRPEVRDLIKSGLFLGMLD